MAGELLGFVGVGRMGGPMALRLLDAGYKLCVYDVSPEALKPFVEAAGIGVAIDAETGNRFERGKKCAVQFEFIGMDGGRRLFEQEFASAAWREVP